MPKGISKRRRLASDLVVLGVDMAKGSFMAVAEFEDGEVSKPRKFEVGRAGFDAFLSFAQAEVKRRSRKGLVVALEPTGHYAEPLATWLLAQKVVVHSVAPLLTSRMKEVEDGTPRKTDPKDCRVIAEIARSGRGVPWPIPTGPFAELHLLSRRRWQLVKHRSQVLNRLHGLLDVVFPELRGLFADLSCTTVRWLLGVAPTPEALLALPLDELVANLQEKSRKNLGEECALALREAAQQTVGGRKGLAAHPLVLRQQLTELDQVETQMREVEAAMRTALAEVPYADRLLQIHGLGRLTLAILLGEVGDLRGYAVTAQLIKRVGLDLIEASSGKRSSEHVRQRVSKRGSPQARRVLYIAAVRLGQNVLSGARHRMVEEGKKHGNKAAIANARRLLGILMAMLRTGADFDAHRHALPQEVERVAA